MEEKTKLTSDTLAWRAGTKPDQTGKHRHRYRAGLLLTHYACQGSQATVLSSPTPTAQFHLFVGVSWLGWPGTHRDSPAFAFLVPG